MNIALNQSEADFACELWLSENTPSPQQMAEQINSRRAHGAPKVTPGDAVMMARGEWKRRRIAAGWA